MFDRVFSKGATFALTILTVPFGLIFGEIGPQIKDFLCGCEYCETVDTGEPLDIGNHLVRCHSWRGGMQKTRELIHKTEQPQSVVEMREEQPKKTEETFSVETLDNVDNPYKDYTWKETELHGWVYATTEQVNFNIDQWIHREDLGWVWTMTNTRNVIYAYDYGWMYTSLYQNTRVLYWYDRRRWLLAMDFTQKK